MKSENEPVLHDTTKRELNSLIKYPYHAVGLVAPDGSGKTFIAKWLVGNISGQSAEKLEQYPYFMLIYPNDGAISIEQIRELNKFLNFKTTGSSLWRRFIIIEHAEAMTLEAQNALLKSLEEPPADTVVVLTLENTKSLLPTVTSRLQLLTIHSPSKQQLLLSPVFNESGANFENAYNTSGGLPGLMYALLHEESEHPLLAAIEQARKLLSQPTFERLTQVDALSKDKGQAFQLVVALQRMAQAAIRQAAFRSSDSSVRRWEQVLAVACNTQDALLANSQAKLAITNLVLAL